MLASSTRPALGLAILLALSACTPPASPLLRPSVRQTAVEVAATADWVTRHHAGFGVSYRRPADWKLVNEHYERIGGEDGYIELAGSVSPVGDNDLNNGRGEVGDWNLLTHHEETFTVAGQAARLVLPRYAADRPALALVKLPQAIYNRQAERDLVTLRLIGDRNHLRAIAGSLGFGRSGLDYARGVVDLLHDYSYRRASVDWAQVRAVAEEKARAAETPEAAYGAVDATIAAVGDPHLWFIRPPDIQRDLEQLGIGTGMETTASAAGNAVSRLFPGSPAERGGLRMGDVVVTYEALKGAVKVGYERPGEPGRKEVTLTPVEFDSRTLPVYRRVGTVGYLEMPATIATANMAPYQDAVRTALVQGDLDGVRGWVIDVRRNGGGTLEPMLAPLAPLLGEGVFAGEEFVDGQRKYYKVVQGRVYYDEQVLGAQQGPFMFTTPAALASAHAPVAVLTGPGTGSAGEYIVMGFSGRAKSRLFGEPTYGVPTGTHPFDLWDGAFLNIATARGIDRQGRVFDGPIPPDEQIPTRFEHFATDSDPVLERAITWIQETP